MKSTLPVSCRRMSLTLIVAVATALPVACIAQPDELNPDAVQLLRRSTDYLAALKQFRADTDTTIEVVLTSGQKIQYDNRVAVTVQRPNKMRAQRVGDLVNQSFYYDGKTLAMYLPDQKYYASVPAPETLEEMLDFAQAELDIFTPAGDFLYKNAYEILMQDVTIGFVVGKSMVKGVRCDHLAFRSPEVDWQIWIQEGKQPLPRKILITTKDIANEPQFSVVFTKWDLAPKLTDSMFSFTPAHGAKKIEFLPLGASRPGSK